MKGRSHGVYTILENEKELVNALKGSKKLVCHFGMSTFRRCTIMDGHLRVRPPAPSRPSCVANRVADPGREAL